ncbi:uncharacterized protein LOC113499457 [Trichoplusia ni]|uniref:Uncharacterized protein LOC113499457 n=1 Tax=Trichoplusia ni TaxID=7111 RepID=A0A7E5W4Z9_TRINI|nr:uncharacterized protein LOC113499457 [Trichoplusia ni]
MHSTFTLTSFNCKNVKRSVDNIREMCRFSDIIALQETWLLPDEIQYLSTIDRKFSSTGTSAVDTAAGLLRGRPYGGVALLWRSDVFQNVSVIQCNNPRVCAIKIVTNDRPIVVISVYMPTDSPDNLSDFTDCLGTLGPSGEMLNAEKPEGKVAYVLGPRTWRNVIRHMSRGKSPGHDGLSIEHLQYGGAHISRVLSLFCNLCMSHSYLPPDLIKTIVIPVVKNKSGTCRIWATIGRYPWPPL